MKNLTFQVADAHYRISFLDDHANYRYLLSSSAPFYVRGYEGELMFTLTVGDNLVSPTAEGEEIGQFDCGGQNHGVYRLENGYKILIFNAKGEIACAYIASKDFTECHASLFGTLVNQHYGIGNALMISFAFAGAYHDILLIHSSVTMYEGKGYLFLGVSGTGKSTHSQLWHEYIPNTELLNDDNPALRVLNGEVRVYGTPWSGKTPCYRNLSCPVGAFLQLKQHPENIIRKEPPLRAFATIISSCSTMIWDRESYSKLCDTVSTIVALSPTYFLECRADEEAVRLSHGTIVQ